MDTRTYSFVIYCDICKISKTIMIPAISLESAEIQLEEVLNLLDHCAHKDKKILSSPCSGEWKVILRKN